MTRPTAGRVPAGPHVLPAEVWRPRRDAHEARVDVLTRGHRDRARRQQPHPVEDFLFSYYDLRPGQLRRWHPGFEVALARAPERSGWRFHRTVDPDGAVVGVDLPAFLVARDAALRFVRRLLRATVTAPAQYGCFGLHEWAMVYRHDPEQLRHSGRRLRLGPAATDEVVRSHQIRCTHYDAFRFFTEPARPRNLVQPTLDGRLQLEQPGCLHASMDIYKWAYRLLPVVPSDLVVDAFVLARAIREVDMRASPYDLADLGYPPIPIETAAGKAQYVAAQREFTQRSQALRARVLDILDRVDAGRVDPDRANADRIEAGRDPLTAGPAPGRTVPGTTPRRS